MKLLVDATPLLLRSAGVKSVLYHWLRGLRAVAPEGTVRTFPPLPALTGLDHEHSITSRWGTVSGLAMLVINQRCGVNFPAWLAGGADIFHASNQVRTRPARCRLTATVHDLTCWTVPELHTAANVRADQRFAERTLLRADALIAVSEYTRQDAIRILGLRPERITTIHNGVAEEYFHAPAPAPGGKPYVLHTGTIEPRKNIDRLLDAWAALPDGLRQAYDLVLAGSAGWNTEATVARLRSAGEGVRWLGYVAESEMPRLTRGAALVVYPSLYEGFGLPLAQAMACGVATLTSNTSCLPEVAGGAARLVNPLSVDEIRDALVELLEDGAERKRLGATGRAHAQKHYRWNVVARRSLDFFERVMAF
jgi:alpha-1,3-rhamnosyl/mannosyltransferase